MMGDQEDEELKMALRLSMQHDPPEPKRSKPGEDAVMSSGGGGDEEAAELRIRRKQRELMAAAAEKRMISSKDSGKSGGGSMSSGVKDANLESIGGKNPNLGSVGGKNENLVKGVGRNVNLGTELSEREAHQLFSMIFGGGVTMDILAQWSNQGIRFSPDPDTSMGLVQHEGGPCGVLAAIQAFVLKYLLFPPEEIGGIASLGFKKMSRSVSVTTDIFSSLTEDKRSRALVRSMADILFLCGNSKIAVIASLNILGTHIQDSGDTEGDEIIAKALDGLSIQSGSDLQKFLRINTYTSLPSALDRLEEMLPLFRCRLGAMLFLISALLSRGLDSIQSDRDDPSQPLVTAPFGHASQEIVNLLLSGMAVANVFDGKIDLGGGMFVNGISSTVEVGFLTLLESLNFCKVGDYLKCPKWPIWVVGSESHYTVLFALDTKVQEENELESRETQIRKAFDAQDQSGGGGFISVEGFHQVLRETGINLPAEKMEHLSNSGFIVWSEFWQSLLDLDKSLGGLKDSSGLLGKKVFDLYHFNGIAKSVANGSQASSESITVQRPRLTKLRVSVPPRWTPEEYMADVSSASSSKIEASGKDTAEEVSKPEPVQHAPLVDCIRTRWPRAVCNWEGDAPSIV